MTRRLTAPTVVAVLAILAAACFSQDPDVTDPDNGDDVVIDMTQNLRFGPAEAHARVGQTVRWRNVSSEVHTVTADPTAVLDPARVRLPAGAATFDSGDIGPGAEYTRTFTVAGRYEYVCRPHESVGMVGTIIIEP